MLTEVGFSERVMLCSSSPSKFNLENALVLCFLAKQQVGPHTCEYRLGKAVLGGERRTLIHHWPVDTRLLNSSSYQKENRFRGQAPRPLFLRPPLRVSLKGNLDIHLVQVNQRDKEMLLASGDTILQSPFEKCKTYPASKIFLFIVLAI